jgi:DNA-3-methyladenine glycosylase II
MTSFAVVPRGPFDFDKALASLHRLPCWGHAGGSAVLPFVLDGTHEPCVARVSFADGALRVDLEGTRDVARAERQIARIFSLDHDATGLSDIARREPRIAPLLSRHEGLRPVCFPSPYEAAVWAIVSQRIRQAQASRIVARIAEEHGACVRGVHVFPAPRALLAVSDVKGLTAVKVDRLHAVATAAMDGELDAERLRALGHVDGPASLRRIPGIGPFWSAGIYLRACGIVDVFPDEPKALAALSAIYPDEDPRRVAERFAPYRMWICFLLRVGASAPPLRDYSAQRLAWPSSKPTSTRSVRPEPSP